MTLTPPTLTGPQPGDYCLTLKQPWAYLVCAGIKPVENRSWPTAHRGRLWIHAAAKADGTGWLQALGWDDDECDFGPDDPVRLDDPPVTLPAWSSLALGAVVGSVEVAGCVAFKSLPKAARKSPFASGPLCWLLERAAMLATPIPAAGKLGLWRWPG